MRRRIERLGLAAAMLGLLLCGCDFFRPEQPEPPRGNAFAPSYVDPDATLQTISDALADKATTIGLDAYLAAFADSTAPGTPAYHQFFWPTDAAIWENSGHTVPADWNLALERNFYIRFVGLSGEAYQLEWEIDEENPDNFGAESATIHRHYAVRTLSSDQSVTGFLAIGYADLTFRLIEGNWRITRWDDRIDPDADPNDPEQITLGRRRLNTTQ